MKRILRFRLDKRVIFAIGLAVAVTCLANGGRGEGVATTESVAVRPEIAQYAEQISAAMKCLDDYMNAVNKQDLAAFKKTFNFPSVRIASNSVTILEPDDVRVSGFNTGVFKDWDHSAWTRREVIDAGPDKVHIETRFTRYRSDGSAIASFNSFYVVTKVDGHWGITARSSFAP